MTRWPFRAGAVDLIVVDAQKQARTIRDVALGWMRPRVPSKRDGRRGTRRAWKRRHPPHMRYGYREPIDLLTYRNGGRYCIICTPRQKVEIDRMMAETERRPWLS